MAAKTQSATTKLSPAERLARKRAAARLRQQRCRARKRQAMLERERGQEKNVTTTKAVLRVSRIDLTKGTPEKRSASFPISSPKEIISSPTREPIYNVVSFESPRSFEEAMRGQPVVSRSSSEQSFTGSPNSPSSPGKPVEVITIPKNKADDNLVPEEEAAIAAMLSLKSGGSAEATTPPSTPPRREHVVTRPLKPTKHRYYHDWEAPSYGYVPRRLAPYYAMPRPLGPPPGQYRYYEPRKGAYSRFD